MTKNKRFKIVENYKNYLRVDDKTKEKFYLNEKEIVECLNALHEENQALKSDRARYEEECRLDVFKELSDENEQLKEKNKGLQGKASSWKITASEQIMEQAKLMKENIWLKQSIKEVVKLLSEEVDVFSEKATEHDIIAYRELNQLDNKDAYYMATATKKAIKMLKELIE